MSWVCKEENKWQTKRKLFGYRIFKFIQNVNTQI